ncbi:MAG: hypothetical protein KDB80_14540 [Planctomycetes bacterium]|nr:hypothetical protein [Planctomycetota bacterium]
MNGPLEVRTQLSRLLDAVEREPELHAEMERAKREFFGGPGPRGQDQTSREACAIRFAEWFLCERPSDLLGDVPVAVAGEQFASGVDCELIRESRVGVFLVQTGGAERPTVRDVVDNEAVELCAVPDALDVGDVLIGRLYASRDDSTSYVPSAAMTIVAASPHIAIAYQRDVKGLDLNRRLTQAELEHLMFRRGIAESQGADIPPLERVEAELERVFLASGKSDVYTATSVSDAMAHAEHPGAVIEPLLEEMAFDTDVDLDELRHLLLALAARTRGGTSREDVGESTSIADVKVRRAPESRPFVPRDDESLGQRLARRISEGLAGHEQVDALFADVEAMLGESLDEPEDGELLGFDDGDLEPLAREFLWETESDATDRDRIESFLAVQRNAPVPRMTVESLEPDDVSRYVLQVWLACGPDRRAADTRAAFELVDRFFTWNEEVQGIARRDVVDAVRIHLLDEIDRLQAASVELSSDDRPYAAGAMFTVVEVAPDRVTLRAEADGGEFDLGSPTRSLQRDDIVVGRYDAANGAFDGMALVVPGGLRHLLG